MTSRPPPPPPPRPNGTARPAPSAPAKPHPPPPPPRPAAPPGTPEATAPRSAQPAYAAQASPRPPQALPGPPPAAPSRPPPPPPRFPPEPRPPSVPPAVPPRHPHPHVPTAAPPVAKPSFPPPPVPAEPSGPQPQPSQQTPPLPSDPASEHPAQGSQQTNSVLQVPHPVPKQVPVVPRPQPAPGSVLSGAPEPARTTSDNITPSSNAINDTMAQKSVAPTAGVSKMPKALLARLRKKGILPTDEPQQQQQQQQQEQAKGGAHGSNPPAAGGAQVSGGWSHALPAGWQQAVDPTYNHPYWFNMHTGERSWVQPVATAGNTTSAPVQAVTKPAVVLATELPPGWNSATDPSTGIVYYFNRSLNKQQWTRPESVRTAAAASAAAAAAIGTAVASGEGVLTDDGRAFVPSLSFVGAKAGYAFKRGSAGVGYYKDNAEGQALAVPAAGKRKRLTALEQQAQRHRRSGTGNEFDPLDPASYSDTPTGGWGVGLERSQIEKT